MEPTPPRQSNAMLVAIEDDLRSRVFEALKFPLMKIAEDEVDKAVNQAIDELNIDLESYKDYQSMRDMISVIIKRID